MKENEVEVETVLVQLLRSASVTVDLTTHVMTHRKVFHNSERAIHGFLQNFRRYSCELLQEDHVDGLHDFARWFLDLVVRHSQAPIIQSESYLGELHRREPESLLRTHFEALVVEMVWWT